MLEMQVRPLIALAEDDPALRALLASALERVGYRVVQFETGEQLVAEVQRLLEDGEPLRLIVTDVRMPTLGGLDAARLLRQAGRATPLIFVTAYGDAWTRAQAAQVGAVLLEKPLSLAALREAVKRAIGP
jgi:two-component system response regulator FixJ